jgi:phosphopantetheinyl transferase
LAGLTSEEDRAKMITLLWTVKEGYVKATGDGIVFGLERIAVEIAELKASTISVDGRNVLEIGWDWTNGWIGDDFEQYGWTAYWRNGVSRTTQIEHIRWDQFIQPFIDET